MKIGVPKEIHSGEKRVATTPEVVGHLRKLGFDVLVETGAGAAASFADEAYRAAGAGIVPTADALFAESDVVLKVRAPQLRPDGRDEIDLLRAGQILISFLVPGQNPDLLKRLADKRVT